METGWNLVSAAAANGGGGRGLNSSCTTTSGTLAWDIWQLGSSSRHDWINIHDHFPNATVAADVTPILREESAFHALLHHQASPSISSDLYAGAGTQFNPPDPQLMCLKLGKRHYFEDAFPLGDRHVTTAKRGRVGPYYSYGYGPAPETEVTVAAPAPMPTVVPRCQVEGCEAALFNAKDYHRRHKVCEKHSKAPKVKVHGIEQRFCQQCSRFHEVSEFDESKRSCRRRLAGHNERRRKTSHDHSLVRNPLQGGRFSSSTTAEHALSLLSSSRNNDQQWKIFSSSDLSSRCSAALRELIAENRAYSSILASKHHFILDHKNQPFSENQNNTSSNNSDHQILLHDHNSDSWGRINEEANLNVTLNLAPVSAFEILSMRGKSDKDTAEECSDIWSSLGGNHVV